MNVRYKEKLNEINGKENKTNNKSYAPLNDTSYKIAFGLAEVLKKYLGYKEVYHKSTPEKDQWLLTLRD